MQDIRQAATKEDVLRAIAEDRLIVDTTSGRVRTKRAYPKARWWSPALKAESDRYPRVSFSHSTGNFRVHLHRLVWFAAGRDVPDGWEVDHKNGKKRDCRLENLEAVPPLENVRRAGDLKLRTIKLDEEAVQTIRSEHANGARQQNLADRFGVSQGFISRVLSRKAYVWA